MTKELEDLRWIRVFSPVHIPKYLVEQVRDRDYTVENFFKYQEFNCIIEDENGQRLNPLSHLYVLANSENMVKGFLWFVVDPLTLDMVINTFSMDKDYWYNGQAMKMASDHVKKLRKKLKLKKVYWITNYPKHSEKYGFKRSKSIIMEYTEEENGKNIDGRHKEERRHPNVDSSNAGDVELNSVSSGSSIPTEPTTVSSAA